MKSEDVDEYYVYLVECNDKSLYCGIAKFIDIRIQLHNKGKGAKYTRSRRPVVLKYYEIAPTKSDALKREHQIKKFKRKQKLKLIDAQKTKNHLEVSDDK